MSVCACVVVVVCRKREKNLAALLCNSEMPRYPLWRQILNLESN